MQSDKSQFLVLSPLHSESGIAERLVSRAAELRVKCCARVSGVGLKASKSQENLAENLSILLFE